MDEGQYGLPEGWVWKSLPQVAGIMMGQSPPGFTYNSGEMGLPFFQGKADFGELHPTARVWCDKPKKVAEPGDILISVRAPVGPTNIAAERCAIGRGLAIIRPKDGLPSRLLREYFVHIERDIAERGTGSTFTAINKEVLESLVFPLPPLPEQHRLIEKIERLLEQSRTARQALDRIPPLLKRFRQSVLAKAFRGELTERDPNDEPASVLVDRIREERRHLWEKDLLARGKDPRKAKYVEPDPPDESRLPPLPTGWAWVYVGQLAEVSTGATPLRSKRAEYYEGGTVPWITSGCLNNDPVMEAQEFITQFAIGKTNAKLFPKGTLLIAMYGEGQTRGRVAELGIDAATNQACAAVRFLEVSSGCKPFVKYYFKRTYEHIRTLSAGGVQPNLNLSHVRRTCVPLAPLAEQRRIVARLERSFVQVEDIERRLMMTLHHAEAVDRAVLARAFRGGL